MTSEYHRDTVELNPLPPPGQRTIRPSLGSLRRIARNAVSILTSDVLNRATTFVMYALVARHLGPFQFGQLSLALTLFYTFQVLAVAGLKTLIVREVAKHREQTDRYLVNGSLVVIFFSFLALGLMALFVKLMGYAPETSTVILLLSLGLLPYSITAICEGVFQAWERMHFIAMANVPANIVKVGMVYLLLSQGYQVRHLVILILLTYVGIAVIEWTVMLRFITRPRLQVDLSFGAGMVRSTLTFLGIDVIIAVWASLTTLLLSRLATETEVGLFSAATQLMVPVALIFQSVVMSVFPIMCRRFEPSFTGLKQIAEQLVELLLIIALPTAVGIYFIADSALLLLYGDESFLEAVPVLRVVIWILVLRALTTALGQVLLASLRERITLRIVAVNTLISFVMGLLLIGRFGLMGAAVTVLLTGMVNFLQHYIPVSKLLSGISVGKLLWKPALAVSVMALYLFLAQDQGLWVNILGAALIYSTVLGGLIVWSNGGPRQLKARYSYLWSGAE